MGTVGQAAAGVEVRQNSGTGSTVGQTRQRGRQRCSQSWASRSWGTLSIVTRVSIANAARFGYWRA